MKFVIPEIHKTPFLGFLCETLPKEVIRLKHKVDLGVAEIQRINQTMHEFILDVQEDHKEADRLALKKWMNDHLTSFNSIADIWTKSSWKKESDTVFRKTCIRFLFILGKNAGPEFLRSRILGNTPSRLQAEEALWKTLVNLSQTLPYLETPLAKLEGPEGEIVLRATILRAILINIRKGKLTDILPAAINVADGIESEKEFIDLILYQRNSGDEFQETRESLDEKSRVLTLIELRKKRVEEIYNGICQSLEAHTDRSAFNPYEESLLKIHESLRTAVGALFLEGIHHPKLRGLLEEPHPEITPNLGFERSVIHWQNEITKIKALAPELTPGIRQALELVITHTSTFRRQKVAPEVEPIRGHLAQIARLTIGAENFKEKNYTLQFIRTGDWDEIQVVLSEYLLRKVAQQKDASRTQKTIQETWEQTCPLEFIQRLWFAHTKAAFKTAEILATEAELKTLEQQEAAEAAEAQKFAQAAEIIASFTRQAKVVEIVPKPVSEPIRFAYVENWGNATQSLLEFSVPPTAEALAEKLEPILAEQKSKISIPTDSVARAILHHILETPPEIRQLKNKEFVGGQNWHKIKRCAARIYIRQDEGTWFIHALARKDWVKSCNLDAKF